MPPEAPAPPAPVPTAPVEAQAVTTEPAPPATTTEPPKAFSQEDVDKIVKDRADRLYRQRVGDVDIDDLKAKAAEYEKVQEAAKTAEQRAAEQAQRALDDSRKAAERADRAELGVEFGITKEHLELLGGGTREDMAARAQSLAPLLTAAREVEQLRLDVAALREGKTPSAVRPVASLHPGASPVVVETTDDAYPAHWNPRRA